MLRSRKNQKKGGNDDGTVLMSTRIYTGEASLEEIEHLGLKRAYIICDPFMEKCGRAGELAAMLNGAGAETRIFSEVVPDPSIEVVAKAIQGMEFEPDGIIALGGGSAIDTAKAAGHLYGSMNGEGRPLLAAVPTTSGTGSEVTSFAVISDTKAQAKYALRIRLWYRMQRFRPKADIFRSAGDYGRYRNGCADPWTGSLCFRKGG